MSGRRGNNEGSIYQRKDGRWAAEYWVDTDAGRKRKVIYRKTRKEVADALRGAQQQAAMGVLPPPARITVRDFLQTWLNDVAAPKVKPSTLQGYRWIIARYWDQTIGHHRLATLQPHHVQAVLSSMGERGLAPRTIRQARTILHGAVAHAEKWGLVARNVVALTDAPRIGRSQTDDALTREEARAYLVAAPSVQFGAACITALLTGMRKGETLALRWSDVALDDDDPYLVVRGTLKRVTGQGLVIDRPKTDTSERRVFLPKEAVAALRGQRVWQSERGLALGASWPDGDLIFTTDRGTPVDPANLRRRHLQVCAAAGIGNRRFHALRHTWANLALEGHVPLEVVSRSLGHASIAITADVYVRVSDNAKRSAVDAVAAIISSA